MATNKIPALPAPTLPFINPTTGQINAPWYQFLNALYQAVGGANQLITPAGVQSSGPISGTTGTFSGTMQFGTYFGAKIIQAGFIEINDAKGASRRLLVG